MPKNARIFHCEKCDFTCSKESNFNTHLLTRKDKRLTLPVQKMPKYFIVKSVTLHVVRRVILIRIFDL